MSKNLLRDAIQRSLYASGIAGAAVALGCFASPAAAQNATVPNQKQPQTLQTIVVTGSHIRRVDLETSNPVVAITAQQIQATGKQTLGDIVQQLPVITGGVENPNVNNGGGSGSTNIGLRGLGASRTLILVDGQRLVGFEGIVDLNFIPVAAVERIEVLTDGASAVYGSDAIGGVINIILKSNYQGAQFQANYGTSDHEDANRKGASFIFGQTSDKGSILAGVQYQKLDELLQSNRKFSAVSTSVSTSSQSGACSPISGHSGFFSCPGGSSSAPHDRIRIPSEGLDLALTPAAIAAGTSPTTLADYQPFTGADKYNYAAVNLIMTPAERTNGFFKGVYHLTDNIDFTALYLHQKTVSESQLAPPVFGNSVSAITIAANSYYNPFGVAFTPSSADKFQTRMFPVGNRVGKVATTKDQLDVALKGNVNIFSQNWTWDVGYNYGHASRITTSLGFPNQAQLMPGMGPSFLDPATGQVVCGTAATATAPANIIPNCTPFDPFNQYNPNTQAVEQASASPSMVDTWYLTRTYHADISGGLFDLPAGTVQLAAGVDYRKEYTNNTVGPLILIEDQPPYSCPLGSACSSHLQGGFNVKEAYAEAFIPILKDLPFVRSLNVTLGDRYSKYNTVGSTNNWKVAFEYKPIDDLMLRGTVTSVFRAPSIGQLFGPPSSSAPFLSADPCDGFTGAPAGSGPAVACQNVPTNGSFKDFYVQTHLQSSAIVGGSHFFGLDLKPEAGKTFDFGAVYSPHFVPGLSLTADFWRVYLNNTITSVGIQTSLLECYNGVMSFCPNVLPRDTSGQPLVWKQPTENLGRIDVKGIDLSGNYRLPQFSFGQFDLGVNATYMKQAKFITAPGLPGSLVLNGVGMMGTFGSALGSTCPFPAGGLCFFPRMRATGTLGWQLGPWDATWTMRYISKFKGGSADPSQYASMAAPTPGIVFRYGATVYNNLQVGYNIEPINTKVAVGVDNVFDKQPPFLYANNSLNANTDPEDFDVIGRYYWGRITVSF